MPWMVEYIIIFIALVFLLGPFFSIFKFIWTKRLEVTVVCEDGVQRDVPVKPYCLKSIADMVDVVKGRKKVEDVTPHPGPCNFDKGYCDIGFGG